MSGDLDFAPESALARNCALAQLTSDSAFSNISKLLT